MHLLDLPNEILHSILVETSGEDVVRCRQVCHRTESLINESSDLQYMIELFAEGKEDIPDHPAPLRSRLKRLTEHKKAWSLLDWTSHKSHQFDDDVVLFIVTGGVAVMTSDLRPKDVTFQLLSSIHSADYRDKWTVTLPFPVGSFAIDPFQDLMVTVIESAMGYSLAVSTMSEGQPHPLACSMGEIPLPFADAEDVDSFRIEIHGDLVAIIENIGSADLAIVNWKNGIQTLSDNWVGDRKRDYVPSFAFLNDKYLLLLVVNAEVFTLRALRIRDFNTLCYSRLPPLQGPDIFPDLLTGSLSPAAISGASVPFLTASDDYLYSITGWRAGIGLRPSYLFIRRSSILSWVQEAESLPLAARPKVVPWAEFRSRAQCIRSSPSCDINGLRAAVLIDGDVHLYDFNDRSVRRLHRQGNLPLGDVPVVYHNILLPSPVPSVSGSPSVLEANSLIFREVVKRLPPEFYTPSGAQRITLTEGAITVDNYTQDRREYLVFSFD